MISWVVPHRQEGEWLEWTLQNIARISPPGFEVIVLDDEVDQMGVSWQRHQGVLRAQNDTILFADAHMDFAPGICERIHQWLNVHPQDVVCVKCDSVDPHTHESLAKDRYGARLWFASGSTILVSNWIENADAPWEVGSVLGGLYGIRKDWYLDGLGGVWQYHRAWGKSEQMVSIMNYLCGGRNLCLHDTWASHLFKGEYPELRHRPFGFRNWEMRGNTLLLIYGFMDEHHRAKAWRAMNVNPSSDYGKKFLVRDGLIDGVEAHIAQNAVKSFGDYVREHCLDADNLPVS